jgi:hypothetical protein
VPWYREIVSTALDGLGADAHERAVELARLPESIRGYEDIKLRSIAKVREHAAGGQALTSRPSPGRRPDVLTSG